MERYRVTISRRKSCIAVFFPGGTIFHALSTSELPHSGHLTGEWVKCFRSASPGSKTSTGNIKPLPAFESEQNEFWETSREKPSVHQEEVMRTTREVYEELAGMKIPKRVWLKYAKSLYDLAESFDKNIDFSVARKWGKVLDKLKTECLKEEYDELYRHYER